MTDINQLLDELQDLVDDKRERVAKLFADIRAASKDVERYRALRFCGEEFNRYVVVSVNSLVVGSMTYSGDRLDFVADQMIQVWQASCAANSVDETQKTNQACARHA